MALKEQLDAFVKSMLAEGTLDQQFQQLQMLEDGSGFVAEVIKMFRDDSERMLNELTILLEQPVVEFRKVDGYVHQLKGSSSSIGAQKWQWHASNSATFVMKMTKKDAGSCVFPYWHWLFELLYFLGAFVKLLRITGDLAPIASGLACKFRIWLLGARGP